MSEKTEKPTNILSFQHQPQFVFPLRPVLPFLLNKKPPVEYFIPPETPETPETLETLETLETVSHLD
jgi:hypothetical protein